MGFHGFNLKTKNAYLATSIAPRKSVGTFFDSALKGHYIPAQGNALAEDSTTIPAQGNALAEDSTTIPALKGHYIPAQGNALAEDSTTIPALKGHYIPAQGNALGLRRHKNRSPERARHPSQSQRYRSSYSIPYRLRKFRNSSLKVIDRWCSR